MNNNIHAMKKYLINQHNNKDKHIVNNEQFYSTRARKKYLHTQ